MNRKFIIFLLSILLMSCNQSTDNKKALPKTWDTSAKKVFVFDPKLYSWAAYDENGKKIKSGTASGGKDFCPDINKECRTVTGTFQVVNKQGADCTSNQFPRAKEGKDKGGAKMPYCMHFHNGYAIHGASKVSHKHISHGCIHVLNQEAKWLNENFLDVGTTIVVLPYA